MKSDNQEQVDNQIAKLERSGWSYLGTANRNSHTFGMKVYAKLSAYTRDFRGVNLGYGTTEKFSSLKRLSDQGWKFED